MATITIESVVHHPSILRGLNGMCGIPEGDARLGQARRELRDACPLRMLRDWTIDDLIAHYLTTDSRTCYAWRDGMGGLRGNEPMREREPVRDHAGRICIRR